MNTVQLPGLKNGGVSNEIKIKKASKERLLY